MNGSDTRPGAFDILAALGLLTRLPLRIDPARAAARGAVASWAWPLAGVVVGLAGGLAGVVASSVGLAPGIAAAFVIAGQCLVTGALHEDGLADTTDGFWGGRERARRLEIMKDSHIGTYGVLALVLVTLVRWTAITTLLSAGLWGALIAAGALSRAPMAAIMAWLPNARGTGLSHSVGRPTRATAVNGAVLAIAVATLAVGPSALLLALIAAAVAAAVGGLARARIGGQTGDVLGAAQQLAEAGLLAALAAAQA